MTKNRRRTFKAEFKLQVVQMIREQGLSVGDVWCAVLRSQGLHIGRYRVRRLMLEHGLRALWRRKFVHTTDSGHALPVSSNVLARRFNPSPANQAPAKVRRSVDGHVAPKRRS